MTVDDFTNNGFTDLILNTATSGMVIFSNNTSGSFNTPLTIDSGLRIFLTSDDIDNDNNIDVISGNPNNTNEVQFYINNGTGTFTFNHNEPNSDALDVTNSKFHLSDLNNNSFKDILYIDNYEIFWKENNQSSSFTNMGSIENSINYKVVFSDDIDNDGDNDIIWSGFDTINATLKLGYIINGTTFSIINETFNNTILVYPNPTKSIIHISNKENYKKVCLYNVTGQRIISTNSNTIDMSNLTKDIYFLTLILENNKQKSVKIIRN